MESYKLNFKQSVAKDIRNIPKKDVQKIWKKISQLSIDPRPTNSEKLTNDSKYRLRVGNYRVLYLIEDRIITITIIKIAHRKEVYKSK